MSPNNPASSPDSSVTGPPTADEPPTTSQLPTAPPALWAPLADVLQALHHAGEAPQLEGAHDWRLQPTDHTPGIRRTPEHGAWQRMVEWNTDGTCRWTAVQGGIWQWPGAAQLRAVEALAAKVRTLLEHDEAYANGDPTISGTDLNSDAWDLLKEVERIV
ncbi:hypothetical protein AB5J56_00045 [Streptomyces sp. R21]|uniref:DUF317 domain-containing protein n=1 Tax=Streptomyces sp. R21 TaxID=3238627 RepID=A0AB39NZD7_9ACTN